MFALLTLVSWSDGAEPTRLYFGARLEPTDGRVIVGAGQRPEGFKDYYDSIGTNKPVVYMTYMRLNMTEERQGVLLHQPGLGFDRDMERLG